MLDVVAFPDRVFEFRQQQFGHHQEPRPAVLEHEAVVVLGHQRIDRNGDNASLDGTEERGRPIDGVGEADQDAFLAAHAERAQDVAEALDAFGQFAIGIAAALVDERDLPGASGIEIALEDIGGEIVVARYRLDRGARRRRPARRRAAC